MCTEKSLLSQTLSPFVEINEGNEHNGYHVFVPRKGLDINKFQWLYSMASLIPFYVALAALPFQITSKIGLGPTSKIQMCSIMPQSPFTALHYGKQPNTVVYSGNSKRTSGWASLFLDVIVPSMGPLWGPLCQRLWG